MPPSQNDRSHGWPLYALIALVVVVAGLAGVRAKQASDPSRAAAARAEMRAAVQERIVGLTVDEAVELVKGEYIYIHVAMLDGVSQPTSFNNAQSRLNVIVEDGIITGDSRYG